MVTYRQSPPTAVQLRRSVAAAALAIGAVVMVIPAPAVAAATTSAGPATSAAGNVGVRLLDEPASAGDDPRARLYIVDHLAPGAVVHRQIQVSNSTSSALHTVLYAAAASIANGAFIGAAGHTANDISTWTSVAPGAMDIPADGVMTATVTLAVPADAAAGERYGAVWAEVSAAPTPTGDITEVSRVGIREYISVRTGAAPAANFTIDSITAQRAPDGHPQVVSMVHNTGGRALDMSGALNLSAGPGGLRAGPFAATLGTTLGIGDIESVTITLNDQIPNGPWMADISLASGLLLRTAQATLTFPDAGTARVVAVSTKSSWPHRLVLIAVGSALTLLVVAVFFLGRSRMRRSSGKSRGGRRPNVPPRSPADVL